MTILNRKEWLGLLIPVVMTVAGVAGGLEWVFASLGMMVLISIAGIGVYFLAKALRRPGVSLKGRCPENDSTSDVSFGGDDFEDVTHSKPVEVGPVSKKDKKLIMEHIDELFEIAQEQGLGEPVEVGPVSKKDKRLIMEHIDELFETAQEQGLGEPVEVGPISKQDKKLIMKHVDEFFVESLGQSGGRLS